MELYGSNRKRQRTSSNIPNKDNIPLPTNVGSKIPSLHKEVYTKEEVTKIMELMTVEYNKKLDDQRNEFYLLASEILTASLHGCQMSYIS